MRSRVALSCAVAIHSLPLPRKCRSAVGASSDVAKRTRMLLVRTFWIHVLVCGLSRLQRFAYDCYHRSLCFRDKGRPLMAMELRIAGPAAGVLVLVPSCLVVELFTAVGSVQRILARGFDVVHTLLHLVGSLTKTSLVLSMTAFAPLSELWAMRRPFSTSTPCYSVCQPSEPTGVRRHPVVGEHEGCRVATSLC